MWGKGGTITVLVGLLWRHTLLWELQLNGILSVYLTGGQQKITPNPQFPSVLTLFWVVFIFQMSAVGITENVKGDSKKFEVWYNGREEVYIIQVC